MKDLLRRLRARVRYRHFDRDLADELEFHRTMTERDLAESGVPRDEVRTAARRAMGNEVLAREEARAVWLAPRAEALWQDARYAVRSLRREPAFAAAALLTLAIGIGSTTGIFSVVNAVLLKPPPYPEPGRILSLAYPDGGGQDGQIFHYVRERSPSFEAIAARSSSAGWNLVAGTHAQYVSGLPVSEGFFEVLGVAPLRGRGFTAEEDRPNGPRAVVLSEPLWRRIYGGREALGEIVKLGGVPHLVVGVMPAGFDTIPPADLWTPLQVSPQNNSWNYTVLGRLRAGVDPRAAAHELDTVRSGLHRELRGISERRSQSITWMSYQRLLGMASREALLLLLGAVGFLLLIACVNVASLQVVRALARRREMATRAALGGGTRRLIQQLLTESVVLAIAGAALGLVATRWGVRSLAAFVPEGLLTGQAVDLDWRVFVGALGIALGAGIFFGLAPATVVRRLDLRTALWEGARQSSGRRTLWLRRAFNVVQVALAVVLLVGAGLLVRTFVNLRGADVGFDPNNVIVGRMSLQGSTKQAGAGLGELFESALARLREIPGVSAAAVANNVPVERGLNLAIEPPADALVQEMRAVDWRYVTPQYFDVFRVPVRTGRAFGEGDGPTGRPVALVNEAFARTYFGTKPVVGRLVQVARGLEDPPRVIVGVVADVKGLSGSGWTHGINALAAPAAPTIYVPVAQVPDGLLQMVHNFFPINWAVRTHGAAPDVERAIQDHLRSIEPTLPFIGFRTMNDLIVRDLEMQRFMMTLLAAFALVALALAAVGMYGLVAYSVSQRTDDVAIRIALGASKRRVLRMFLAEGVLLTAVGVAAGLVGAAAATTLLTSMTFGVTPLDTATFATVSLVLLAVATLASLLPALRAARTDPIQALRRG